MEAVERLKRDHHVLAAKLNVLESALRMGPGMWFVLRELSLTLSRQLRDHIKREELLLAACRHVLPHQMLQHVMIEHRDEPEQVRAIIRLFQASADQSLELIRPVLGEVIRRLRQHMAEEELDLFPLFERTLCGGPEPEIDSPHLSASVDDTMTVNRILQLYPAAREVFERLFVNLPAEGCSCVDEIAWRHGMESRELLAALDAAIAARHDTSPRAESARAAVPA